MKIYSMTATFGKLEHATLTLEPGLNIIHGPNEWGKSTWCAFLVAMLYGIDTRERTTATALADKEHYAPWSGAPMAGRIDLCWQGQDITIERSTRGRIPFGNFKAYETATGLPVSTLTADNCGKMLLGAEKSVFTRTGFVRLTDMPVTQDEALRRRLSNLVTTGDESGQSDDLAQKLKDLKNKVRANRANGLIPQALQEQTALADALRRHDDLLTQHRRLTQRREDLTVRTAQLQNHKAHLAHRAAQSRIQQLDETQTRLKAVSAQVAVLETACAQLPDELTLQSQLNRARDLQNQKDSLQLELAMLPAPPVAPQGLALHDPAQAQKDFTAYTELSAVTPPAKALKTAAIIAAILALAGIATLFATLPLGHLWLTILCAIVFAAGGMVAAVCGRTYRNGSRDYKEIQQQLAELTGRYAPLPPDRWISAAENYVNQQDAYQAALAAYEASRTGLQQRLQQVMTDLQALPATDGHGAAMEKRRALADAQREQQHLQHLAQTLQDALSLPPAPTEADTLTYSEADTARLLSDCEAETRQLTAQLGSLEGQMLTLGDRAQLTDDLAAVNTRLEKLSTTYAALELAQATLAQANASLQRRFAPAITQAARENFSHITGGRYDRLTLSDDLAVHTAARDEDTLTGSLWRSDGTADQLYLSLRLAVAQALTPDAPLVLDDALARFDDTRMAAALEVLRQTAAHKQILLFTCHTRETNCL